MSEITKHNRDSGTRHAVAALVMDLGAVQIGAMVAGRYRIDRVIGHVPDRTYRCARDSNPASSATGHGPDVSSPSASPRRAMARPAKPIALRSAANKWKPTALRAA